MPFKFQNYNNLGSFDMLTLRHLEQENQCTNSIWTAKQDIKLKKHLPLVRVMCNPSGLEMFLQITQRNQRIQILKSLKKIKF